VFRGSRGPVAPERVDQPVPRDEFVRVQQEEREERARLGASERERTTVPEDVDRPE
jgi:hypothetical protein